MVVEINGITYKQKEKQPKKPMSKRATMLLMMAMTFGGLDDGTKDTSRKRPEVDIVKEFELIQQKKSKLSRNDREWVVFQFNKMYERVEV